MFLSPKVSCREKGTRTMRIGVLFKMERSVIFHRGGDSLSAQEQVTGQDVGWKQGANTPWVLFRLFPHCLGWLSDPHLSLENRTSRFFIFKFVRHHVNRNIFQYILPYFSDLGITKVGPELCWPRGLHVWKSSCFDLLPPPPLKITRHCARSNQDSTLCRINQTLDESADGSYHSPQTKTRISRRKVRDRQSLSLRVKWKSEKYKMDSQCELMVLVYWQPTAVFLPGESPWTEEPGGLQATRSQRVRHAWSNLAHTHIKFKLFPISNFYISFVMEKGIDTYSRQEYWSG